MMGSGGVNWAVKLWVRAAVTVSSESTLGNILPDEFKTLIKSWILLILNIFDLTLPVFVYIF